MACSGSFEINAFSESLRLLIRENKRQHSIFNTAFRIRLMLAHF